MFGNRKAVLEMSADAASSAGGGALEYAGFWRRYAAISVDSAIIYGVIALIAVAGVNPFDLILQLAIWFVFGIYFIAMESSPWQATLGKRLVGIYVTDLQGERVSFLRSLGRSMAKGISAMVLYIGFLMAAFTGRKQGLHDMLASCLVLRTPSSSTGRWVGAFVASYVVLIGMLVAWGDQIQKLAGQESQAAVGEAKAPKALPAKPPVAKAPEVRPVPAATDTSTAPQQKPDAPQSASIPRPEVAAPSVEKSTDSVPSTVTETKSVTRVQTKTENVDVPRIRTPAPSNREVAAKSPPQAITSQCVYKAVMTDEDIAKCR
jgi:uncharacterized RDD family membrane protein YckC